MAIYKSGEDYLETILILNNANSYVRSIDVATEMGFSKASVSRAMGILKNDGLITIENDGQINLTPLGLEKATSVYDRHKLIKTFLIDCVGVTPNVAEEDACKIEHVISDETYLKLKRFVQANTKDEDED
jgi:Mn-dependent DtxR family transcriptional regulator